MAFECVKLKKTNQCANTQIDMNTKIPKNLLLKFVNFICCKLHNTIFYSTKIIIKEYYHSVNGNMYT